MQNKFNNPLVIGHFGHDVRHNDLCTQTGFLLREKYNLIAARTPREMKTPIDGSSLYFTFSHHINEDTHAELLNARSIADKAKKKKPPS